MVIVFGSAICIFGGILLHGLYLKMDPDFSAVRAAFARWSSPYNVLWTFAACFLLLLGGHNRPVAAFGGSLVVVGLATVLGHVLRLVRHVAALFLNRDRDVVRPGRRPRIIWEESELG